MSHRGEPLQVLYVEEDGACRVDEDVLSRVCGHEVARSLPVAVVSVVGATRGGKSSLLDFCLRYLRAPDAARRFRTWIDADDRLTGFRCASGLKPNETKGILLWSEPIIVTQLSFGVPRKLAVLLMDTQVTVNTDLSVSNTIFAMATLMSSILVYNVSQGINDDYLRHLQLFAEMGRMARVEDASKKFQSLIFRVRDWARSDRLPYDAAGGDRYLQEVYKSSALLRDEIWPCFENVSCVLTPQPDRGYGANFSELGMLKNVLREVVPHMLEPSRLVPKIIGDSQLTLGRLPIFFRNYLALFNSEDIAPALSIYAPISAANLQAAELEARAAYRAHMDRSCGGGRDLTRSARSAVHRAALTIAHNTFVARSKLGDNHVITTRLQALDRELNSRLPSYISSNNDKLVAGVANAKAAYKRHMDDATVSCVLPASLQAEHGVAVSAAVAVYDRAAAGESQGRARLLQELESMLTTYHKLNYDEIVVKCASAREHHEARLSSASRSARCLHPDTLGAAAHDASAGALLLFDRAWRVAADANNEHRNALIQHMEDRLKHYESKNETENNLAIQEALQKYQNRMNLICGSDRLCLHPLDLASEQARERAAAVEHLHGLRSAHCRTLPTDIFLNKLHDRIEHRYLELQESNEELNRKAVARAMTVYEEKLDNTCRGAILQYWCHRDSKQAAIEYFQLLRREGQTHDSDAHLHDLFEKIHEVWTQRKLSQ